MPRPGWATALSIFCGASVVFLVARDLFVPEVREVEVWFGIEVYGSAAWWTAPIHWAVFVLGAYGYWRLRSWVWPWASIYAFYVAFSHLVWNLTSANGGGWPAGFVQLILFSVPAAALWFARPAPASHIIDRRTTPPPTD